MSENPSPPQTENEKTHELMRLGRALRRLAEMKAAEEHRGTLHNYYHGLASGLEGNSAA